MSKISLKSILKKTFKKSKSTKSKKKAKTKKIVKLKKVKKKINKLPKKLIKTKKIPLKKSIKSEVKTTEQKSDGLRITKTNEAKPEIKKVKKQESQKKEYKVKEYVVYPKHGVCKIIDFKKTIIGGIELESYVLSYDKDKATGYCPVNKQSHLRPLATINQVNKCISILKSKPKIKRSMWSRRAQEYEAKISSGKIYELAEVVRDLNKGDDIMIDQSYSERQLFEKAYDRLLTEFQIVLNLSPEDSQKKLDKALKRNLEKNQQNLEKKVQTNPQANQETEDSENLINETEE